jgi:hypothetical protein
MAWITSAATMPQTIIVTHGEPDAAKAAAAGPKVELKGGVGDSSGPLIAPIAAESPAEEAPAEEAPAEEAPAAEAPTEETPAAQESEDDDSKESTD